MKTQVMYLEPQDDVISIRDKMLWTKTGRLLLVFPAGQRLSIRALDLLLLRRQAATLGVQLGIVTRSRSMQRQAFHQGVPAFRSTDEGQVGDWTIAARPVYSERKKPVVDLRTLQQALPSRETAWQRIRLVRIVSFSIAVISIFSLLGTLLPFAEVTLEVPRLTQTLTVSFFSNPDVIDISNLGAVPTHATTWEVDAYRTIDVKSQGSIPISSGEGDVVFTNLGLDVVGIPAGTVLRTHSDPSVSLITLEDGVVAGGPGEEIKIRVRALEPGSAGNLPSNTQLFIDGGLGALLSVSNTDTISGGAEVLGSVPSVTDREMLYNSLVAELKLESIDSLEESLGPGTLVFPDTVFPEYGIAEVYSPDLGQPGRQLTLTLTGNYHAQYASGADLQKVGSMIMDAGLSEGFIAMPDTLRITEEQIPITSPDGTTTWEAEFTRDILPVLDTAKIALEIRGMTIEKASLHLAEKYSLVSPLIYRLSPSFWPWIPITVLRIKVVIK